LSCHGKPVVFATATLLLFSCASQPPISATAPPVKSIAFITSKDLPSLKRPDSRTEVAKKHAYGGAAAGTAGGAAVGAIACGPVFYGACVAIVSWYGLVVGSVGGTALGLHNYSGLSDTDSAYVDQVLFEIGSRRNFHGDLQKQVRIRVLAESIAAPQDAEFQVAVWVSQINFIEVEKELISTEMHGTMILARAQEPNEQPYEEVFTASAAKKDIDDLIAGDGHLLESAIDECLSEIAKLMSSRLERMLADGAGH